MTSIPRSRRARSRRSLATALVMAVAMGLAGCSTGGVVGDYMPNALGGLPEGTPQRPGSPNAYPAVHAMPPPRATTVLTDPERNKLEADLAAARARAAVANTPPPGGD
jgi:hypothetical protein